MFKLQLPKSKVIYQKKHFQVEAVALAHHIHHHHHDSASLQGSVRSVGSRYGSKHSLAPSNGIGGGAAPAAVVVGAGVAPARVS